MQTSSNHHRKTAPNWKMIATEKELEQAVDIWQEQDFLGVDTESSGFYRYHSNICLLQISTCSKNYFIDLLAIPAAKISKICSEKVFANRQIIKIFHAAAGDIVQIVRELKIPVYNIFDTFLASRYLNRKSHSLVSIIRDYIGVELSKKEQKSDWCRRPLSIQQCQYAALDTCFLLQIFQIMRDKMNKMSDLSSDLFAEDLCDLEKISELKISASKNIQRTLKLPQQIKQMPEQEAIIYKKIFYLVDRYAYEKNIARFRLISDKQILEMAQDYPKRLSVHPRHRSIFDYVHQHFSTYVLPDIDTNKSVQLSKRQKKFLFNLKEWRARFAMQNNISSELLLSNRVLLEIIQYAPKTMEQIASMQVMGPVRLQTFGKELLRILQQ